MSLWLDSYGAHKNSGSSTKLILQFIFEMEFHSIFYKNDFNVLVQFVNELKILTCKHFIFYCTANFHKHVLQLILPTTNLQIASS